MAKWLQSSLPEGAELDFLQEWFGSRQSATQALTPFLGPIREFLERPAKHVRAQLVQSSFELVRRGVEPDVFERDLLESLASWVEALHAGSLMVDDIQDESALRRGGPALHGLIGTASAINSANWLYFWPADRFSRLNPSAEVELRLYRSYHQMMARAHLGQAMDLGYDMTEVPRDTARAVSAAAMNLKTGELMRMSCEFGAIAASADAADLQVLSEFGRSFGVTLQMLNDLFEVSRPAVGGEPAVPLVRPSHIWGVASEVLGESEFRDFQQLMKADPESRERASLASHPVVERARVEAIRAMKSCIENIRKHFESPASFAPIEELAERVIHGYQ
jgi:geranylgeranyl pyrophosphate synthase